MPDRAAGEPSWGHAGPPAARTAAAYFEMFGGLIGAVASDCGEVAEA